MVIEIQFRTHLQHVWATAVETMGLFTQQANYALIDCTLTQAAPQSRMAEIYDAVNLTDTQENPVTLSFEDDGWGNAGTLILDFNKNEITCKIQDLHYTGTDGGADWGFANGSYTLQKNNDAFNLLAYTMDDYYEVFPEEKSADEDPGQPYDTSKASGILASLGMSEQQFKDSCAFIYGLPTQDLVISIGQQNCYDTGCTTEEYIYQTYSEREIEEHLNTHHYFVGEKIVASVDKEILDRMEIYREIRADIGVILRKLCQQKGVEIIEANACPDHIHMLISIPPKYSVSQIMGYLKGKSSLMIFDRHANLKYKYGNRHFWARGYFVDTVGRNKKAIKAYIQNQLQED